MWGEIIKGAAKFNLPSIASNFYAGSVARGGQKRAGTILSEGRQREAEAALALPGTVNPMIQEAYQRAQHAVSGVGNRSVDEVIGAGREANTFLDPYMTAGKESLTTLSDMAQSPEERFTGRDLEMDPGYAFRLAEGQKALERSAAARGSLRSGGTLKALERYAQGAASQEYANAFDRSLNTFKTNQTVRQQRFSNLTGLATLGYGASGQAGRNLTESQTTAGNWRNRAAELESGYGINSAGAQAGNILQSHNVARGLRLEGDEATANSILGSTGTTANLWAGVGNTLSGGFSDWADERYGEENDPSKRTYRTPYGNYGPGQYGQWGAPIPGLSW